MSAFWQRCHARKKIWHLDKEQGVWTSGGKLHKIVCQGVSLLPPRFLTGWSYLVFINVCYCCFDFIVAFEKRLLIL